MQMMRERERDPINRESNYIKHLIEHLDAELSSTSQFSTAVMEIKSKNRTEFPELLSANTNSNFLITAME